MSLPSFSALEALQLLGESGLDIPLIVLTGMVSEETVVECMKHGAADYLLKDRMTRLGTAVRRFQLKNFETVTLESYAYRNAIIGSTGLRFGSNVIETCGGPDKPNRSSACSFPFCRAC
jgi:DNA-binding NtrC family response regulator